MVYSANNMLTLHSISSLFLLAQTARYSKCLKEIRIRMEGSWFKCILVQMKLILLGRGKHAEQLAGVMTTPSRVPVGFIAALDTLIAAVARNASFHFRTS